MKNREGENAPTTAAQGMWVLRAIKEATELPPSKQTQPIERDERQDSECEEGKEEEVGSSQRQLQQRGLFSRGAA